VTKQSTHGYTKSLIIATNNTVKHVKTFSMKTINVTCKQWKLNRPKSITKIRKDKENATTYIFFDFECTQDDKFECAEGFCLSPKTGKCVNCNKAACGSFKPKPNLCVVQKVCEQCMDRAITPESICASCGKNERVFSGMDTSTEFCRWLFSEEKFESTVFAHNFRSYDSIPIMTYLYENAILPKVITTSAVSQCKTKFLDSLNFLPMRLADLPDVFGKENQNIILEHLPDMEYYNPNAMKPEDRFSDGNSVLL
jgi:hypothetical protein